MKQITEDEIVDAGISFQMSQYPVALGGDNFYDKIRELNRNKAFEAGAK